MPFRLPVLSSLFFFFLLYSLPFQMAETPPKRPREEAPQDSSSELDDSATNSKRLKPYNNILNLLDEDEDEGEPTHEPSQDLSAIFTTLQKELSSSTGCDPSSTTAFDHGSPLCAVAAEAAQLSERVATGSDTSIECGGGDENDGVRSVMRHLLEASDDELGIPNTGDDSNAEKLNSEENFPFDLPDHELWELEDEAANYYTMLQSELFML